MDISDEELIKQFAGLQTEENAAPVISIPANEIATRKWELCLMIKVCTDRKVFDTQFERQMRRLWAVAPPTIFKSIDAGVYLVQFCSNDELRRVQNGGPWVYRQDLLAIGQCNSVSQLTKDHIKHGEVGVQLHHLSSDDLTSEVINTLLEPVGHVISDPVSSSINGKPVLRTKLIFPLDKSLNDRVCMRHPSIGDKLIYIVYEKVGRICLFCRRLGHEMGSCAYRLRLARIKAQFADQNRPELEKILEPKKGPWMVDTTLIPVRPGPTEGYKTEAKANSGGIKRSLKEAFNGTTSQSGEDMLQPDKDPTAGCNQLAISGEENIESLLNKRPKTARPHSPPQPN